MSDANFTIPNFSTMEDARDLLISEAAKRCALQPEKVEIAKHFDGLSLRLHNQGLRPTVYQVSIITDLYGKACRLVIDTIIAENKDHECLKNSFSHNQAIHIINLLARLSEQSCDGNKSETEANYHPLGLLYRKLSDEERAARVQCQSQLLQI